MNLVERLKKRQDGNVSPADRREANNKFIKSLGVTCFEDLPLVESSTSVVLKDIKVIAKRAIATLITIQVAKEASKNGNYEEAVSVFNKLIDIYGVRDSLLDKEKKIFDGTYSRQDVIDICWTYECYWVLVWALGLIDDIKVPDKTCDPTIATELVYSNRTIDAFIGKCKLRDVEEILDMLDLYYRYNWACCEARVKQDVLLGTIISDVVVERRRGLEWLFSEENDWNEISLDT